ncbi:MAG: GNAT family N-acetyltransferase [Solobacterium sp.]|nr:GNAT family N-acetyltransferase [Solobacterium sp.]
MRNEFDPLDHRIRFVKLKLERDVLPIPDAVLPDGFHFVFYQPGDRDAWIVIEQSAGEFSSYEEGIQAWNTYFEPWASMLEERMLFIEDSNGHKVATGSVWFDVHGIDTSPDAWMHWVAVSKNAQGNGLSKPLIAKLLSRMDELGFTHVKLPTQTTTWLACRIYLDFGFRPTKENWQNSILGWRIIKTLTNHPALSTLTPCDREELLASDNT